jgi:hypothetical protein
MSPLERLVITKRNIWQIKELVKIKKEANFASFFICLYGVDVGVMMPGVTGGGAGV